VESVIISSAIGTIYLRRCGLHLNAAGRASTATESAENGHAAAA